jgi:hydrogenase large subunit
MPIASAVTSPISTPNGFNLDNSGRRIVVDPVTRIEGHLRIEVNVDQQGVIRNAVSTGTMWRGIEVILRNRDPRDAWAFTERICGVCTGTHALTSVRAVEDALGIKIPENANSIRNIMQLCLQVHDHLVHFYHLHAFDWVDVVSALKADPKATSELAQSISPWPLSSPGYFRDLQGRLKRFVESGQLGPFKNAYWGHPAYKLPPEANLMATAHYLEALDFQKEIVKIHTIYGGKNPHPNWLVGGVPCAINLDGTGAVGAINMERLNLVSSIIDRTIEFVEQVYIPDLLAIASFYKDWLHGGGLSGKSVMAYGDIPERANDFSAGNLLLPRGVIVDGKLTEIHDVDQKDPEQIQEFVTHSWYKYPDETKGLHPFDGITEASFELGPATKGTKTRIEALDEAGKYSWIKSPRWRGHAVEVGPLARWIVGYAMGRPEFKDPVEAVLKKLDLPVTALFSTLGRTAARGLECQWAAQKMRHFQDKLVANIKSGDLATASVDKWEPEKWPSDTKGAGFTEAPRGALGHWVHIKDGKIANYQCVVPTTWNGSPRDPKGNIGAFEASLMNTPMADPEKPLEILRTIHSFDPCLACSTHVLSEDGQEMTRVTIR